jgi:uncharacterized protein involved in outer membrane biogenesis
VVVALFAALIAPWFVNWNDYKTTFEAEAGRILGQPVIVDGSASASILPSPSLTFTDVRVGDSEGKPMMTVDRFEVTIELMPLLQGEIRVVSMKLRKPVVSVSVDDSGAVDWLRRNEASQTLDPDKVVLENVEIADGEITYSDARTGIRRVLQRLNAQVEARSLSGPWRIDGSYLDGGQRVPFRISTGRRAENGAIRVKTEITPANWLVALVADGDLAKDGDELLYKGTYNLSQVVAAGPEEEASATPPERVGWRSEGSFTLTRDRLLIDKAVLSEGPVERPYSVAGSLKLDLGPQPFFEATVQARQLDLDRSLGSGPAAPVEPAKAAESLVDWLSTLYVPPIRGRLGFSVPGIIVGGALIQDASFQAEPRADAGWRIIDFRASLPGQASLEANGALDTVSGVGFAGDIHLIVRQPSSFAAWWRGNSEQGAGRLLAPFDLSGRATIRPGQVAVDALAAKIGDATVRGRFAWTEARTRDHRRHLGTDLAADRIDSTQLRALAELLVGKDLADTGVVADSYAVKLSTRSFVIDELTLRDLAVDASFADDALTVNEFGIGDVGGAGINITQGRIDNPLKSPRGHLEARLSAPLSLTGFADVVDKLLPGSAVASWLKRAAPALVPAVLDASIEAPPADGSADFRILLKGNAADTSLTATLGLRGSPQDWRNGTAGVSLVLDSANSAGLGRQAGLVVPESAANSGSHLELGASGVPATGLDLTLAGDFAGLAVASAGKLTLAADRPVAYAGSLKLDSADLEPLMTMAALDIPGAASGTKLKLDGAVALSDLSGTFSWQSGTIGDRLTGGAVTIGRKTGGSLEFTGDLTVDEVDLGWITALGLGFAVEPTGDRFSPWSKAPFGEPTYGNLTGRLAVTTDRLTVGDGLDIAAAALDFTLDPNRIDLNLTSGHALGGAITGGLSINNVGGNTNASGRLELKGAGLDAIAWQRAGRPVATGVLDLSANFDATGRSPAGLISSLTGGGTVSIRDGVARNVNPRAVSLIIRASDLGQEFTDEALQAAFLSYIDGGDLKFAEAGGAFSIAAGTVRLKSLAVTAEGASATGGATIDLNTLDLDSDWTLNFDIGEDKAKGTVPQVGLVFRGPLAEPARTVDVVQFGAYLNIRQEERIQEILDLEQADRAEKERLNRLKRKLREDADRRQRDREAAAAAEAARRDFAVAAAARLEAFHTSRENLLARRAGAALAGSKLRSHARDMATAADAAEAARVAADGEAKAAADHAVAAKEMARQASRRAEDAAAARAAAETALATAAADRDAAAADAEKAAAAAEKAKAAVSLAVKAATEKGAVLSAAEAAVRQTTAEKDAADKAVADKQSAEVAAADLATRAVDEDATASSDAATKAASLVAAEGAAAKAAEALAGAKADDAAARQAATAATAKAASAAAAKTAAEASAGRAETGGAGPAPSGTDAGGDAIDPAATAAIADAAAAADKAAAAKAKADEIAERTSAILAAAEEADAAAKAALDKATAEKTAADQRIAETASARQSAEDAAAAAKIAAAQATAAAAEKAVYAAQASAALTVAAREADAAKAAADAAAKDAAAALSAADAAARILADRNAAVAAAEAALAKATADETDAVQAAADAAAAATAAEAEAKRATDAARAAAVAEANAREAAEKAAAEAAKAADGLSALDPGVLTPVAGSDPQPVPKPRRLKPVQPLTRPLLIIPQIGQ